jgi:hypothetical protein
VSGHPLRNGWAHIQASALGRRLDDHTRRRAGVDGQHVRGLAYYRRWVSARVSAIGRAGPTDLGSVV